MDKKIKELEKHYQEPQYPLKNHLVYVAKHVLRTIRHENIEGKLELHRFDSMSDHTSPLGAPNVLAAGLSFERGIKCERGD